MDVDKLSRLTRISLSVEEKAFVAKSLGRLITYFDDILAAEQESISDDNVSSPELAVSERPAESVDFLFESEHVLQRDGGRYFLIPRVIE